MCKAFTLIEVIIALFLLTVGTMGAFAVTQRVITFTSISSDQLTATYLAQEGIELVRNARDSNWLAGLTGSAWDSGFSFGTETGLLGKFERNISVSESVPDEKMDVSVVVSWEERGRSHQVTVETELYNWR